MTERQIWESVVREQRVVEMNTKFASSLDLSLEEFYLCQPMTMHREQQSTGCFKFVLRDKDGTVREMRHPHD